MKKILMILTSHSALLHTDTTTGVWLGEFTDPYYEFIDAGFEVTLASPEGGEPPVDPMSKLTENITASNRKFQEDEQLQSQFENTFKLSDMHAEHFDAVFFAGGHGPIWDLATDEHCGKLLVEFKNAGKPIAAVCHGSAAFLSAENLEEGFLSGKRMTCFSNIEEKMVMKVDNMPYLLENALTEKGVQIENSAIPFMSNVKIDGKMVTGQNPLSAGPTARALIELLG